MHVDNQSHIYAALMSLDQFFDKSFVRKGKKSQADGARRISDSLPKGVERSSSIVRQEPKFDVLAAYHRAKISGRCGEVFFQKTGHLSVYEADHEVVVHSEGLSGHVCGADEYRSVVEDQDFVVHQSGRADRNYITPFEYAPHVVCAVWIVVYCCMGAGFDLVCERGKNGAIA